MSNDEPTTARVTRRASRQNPDPEPRLGDPDSGSDLGEIAGDLERKCGLCTFVGIDTEFATQQEFWRHLKDEHPKPTREEFVACETHCRWLCSVCGAEQWYPASEGVHGGPHQRSFDRRFGLTFCREGKYPSHKPAYGLIGNSRGPVVFYHEGLTFSEQPVQDDPSLAPFLEKKRKASGRSTKGSTGGVRRSSRAAA